MGPSGTTMASVSAINQIMSSLRGATHAARATIASGSEVERGDPRQPARRAVRHAAATSTP